ncbi:MAG: hypothetical protein ACI37R_08165 [Candidatus Avigastranaerophilus sp.]
MGYAVFAQRKVVLTSRLNTLQLMEMQMDDKQYRLATDTTQLQQQLSAIHQAQSNELSGLYDLLSATTSDQDSTEGSDREQISAEIESVKNKYQGYEDEINEQIYDLSAKENSIELEKKRLETQITKVEKELENIEKSEASAIERANPKYDGVG